MTAFLRNKLLDETHSRRLQAWGRNIWYCDGSPVNFFGIPYSTRMVVIQLRDASAWIWSPIALNHDLVQEIESTIGTVTCIVAPNKLHWIFLKQWQDQYPQARIYGAPGLAQRNVVANIRFDGVLGDEPEALYAADIDQIMFHTTNQVFDEVVFFHRDSKTVIFCDMVQRFHENEFQGWRKHAMRWDGLTGSEGGAPGEVRALYWVAGSMPMARAVINHVLLEWQPDTMIIAHGEMADQNAVQVVAHCFRWIPEHPPATGSYLCGCVPPQTVFCNDIKDD